MKRKMERVTPKAGTLKQANRNMRTGMSLSGKLSAFLLMLSMAFANMSFVQDDDTLQKGTALTSSDTVEKVEACCTTTKPATRRSERNVFKLYNLPSEEMIRKSDSEAYQNLRHSLTENKLRALKYWMNASDRAINRDFLTETTVDMNGSFSSKTADEAIADQFQAENIRINTSGQHAAADVDMHDVFTAEVTGIRFNSDVANADEDLHNDFLASAIWASYPSAEMFSKADAEINFNIKQDLKYNSFASTKTAKK